MNDLIRSFAVRSALFPALVLSPYLLARITAPKLDWTATLTVSGMASIAINLLAPLLLHMLAVPITGGSLAILHGVFFLAVLLGAVLRGGAPFPLRDTLAPGGAFLCVLLAVLVLPLTHLAGVDTYKWQGLATNVRVEQAIPWLIHPLSLLGFTPRSYPSAHPLLLASVQLLGNLGVDGGFFMVSAFTGSLGIFAALALGRRIFNSGRDATWFAFLYAFSPVFVRYTHWATGRGLFLAILPLLILSLLDLPRARGAAGFVLCAVLAALSHKTGLFASVMLAAGAVAGLVCRPLGKRVLLIAFTLIALPVAVLLSPNMGLPGISGRAVGFLVQAVMRFGIALPLAAVGLPRLSGRLSQADWGKLLPAALISLSVSFAPDMYGAMIALPFVTAAAVAGIRLAVDTLPRPRRIAALCAGLTLVAAIAVVVRRSASATPGEVKQAADFLETFDPQGPYRIEAPGRTRVQLHAYVSGCPRFEVKRGPQSTVHFRLEPVRLSDPREILDRLIRSLRTLLTPSDIDVSWYGHGARTYYVVHKGKGVVPAGARELYDRDGVQIYAVENKPDRFD